MKIAYPKTMAVSAVISIAGSLAYADIENGELTGSSPTWDRLSVTGATITGSCDATAPDSLNDSLAYELFYFSPTSATAILDVSVRSLEAMPLDFDPFIAVYCTEFDPADVNMNLLHINDDGGGYPDAHALNASFLDEETVYVAVVTSYSDWAPSQHGSYEIELGADLVFIDPCPVDVTDDEDLDVFDLFAFIALFNAMDPAADFNGDGFLDNLDLFDFIAGFMAGCP